MADYLRPASTPTPPPLSSRSVSTTGTNPKDQTHHTASNIRSFRVSLLASSSEITAHALSRPRSDQSAVFASPEWDTRDTPSLRDSIGTLDCEVISTIPLKYLGESEDVQLREEDECSTMGSELFICRVLRVVKGKDVGSVRPLLHWRQKYITVDGTG
jgi:flavin reductase (DIM6/NTAB) family NADH-FMN oxidoreductase RutF